MYCVAALKVFPGSKRAVAASAPDCRPASVLAISAARASISGSFAAASSIAEGNALASGTNEANSKSREEKRIVIMCSKDLLTTMLVENKFLALY